MKKIIAFILLLTFNLPFAMADLLPDYGPNQKLITGKNIMNVSNYPDWVFYQKVFEAGRESYRQINEDGNLGCNSGSFHYGVEIWALKKDKAANLLLLSRNLTQDDFKENDAIRLFENGAGLLSCNSIVRDDYQGDEVKKSIIVTPEMLGLTSTFEIKTNLSELNQNILKSATYDSYEKFLANMQNLSEEKKETAYKLIISKIDNLLKTEKREAFIFTLSYLKYLAQNSLNG